MLNEFEMAIVDNDHARLRNLFEHGVCALNEADRNGRTLIDLAVSRAAPTTIEFLIQAGAVMNKQEFV